jgi:hypothetical protein
MPKKVTVEKTTVEVDGHEVPLIKQVVTPRVAERRNIENRRACCMCQGIPDPERESDDIPDGLDVLNAIDVETVDHERDIIAELALKVCHCSSVGTKEEE